MIDLQIPKWQLEIIWLAGQLICDYFSYAVDFRSYCPHSITFSLVNELDLPKYICSPAPSLNYQCFLQNYVPFSSFIYSSDYELVESEKANIFLIIGLVIALAWNVWLVNCDGDCEFWRGPNFIPLLSHPNQFFYSLLIFPPNQTNANLDSLRNRWAHHIWWSDTKNPFFSLQSS